MAKKKTKDRILESAAELFAVKGYVNTSIQEISEAAEANIAAVNYHFKSKELLFHEVVDYSFDITQRAHGVASDLTNDPEDWMRAHLIARMNTLLDDGPAGYFPRLVQQHCTLGKAMAENLFQIIKPISDKVEGCIRQLLGPCCKDEHIRCIAVNIHALYMTLNRGPQAKKHLFGTATPDQTQIDQITCLQQEYVIGGIRALRTKIEEEA